jgi:omega-amidase
VIPSKELKIMQQRRVAAVQMDVKHGDPDANFKHALEMLDECSARKADFAILPEMWLTGYAFRELREFGQRARASALDILRTTARRCRMTIVAGSLPETDGDKVYNTAYVIDLRGEILEKYRKIHLFSYSGEERFLAGGESLPPLLETDGVKYGATICYDIRFPEVFRPLAVRGAQIVFVPAQLPHPRLNHWRVLLQSRAIENQTFVVGCNRVGKVKHLEYFGHSMLIDPWGEILAEGGEEEAVITADFDLGQVAATREKMTVFQDRMPAVYRTFGE